MHFLCVCIYIYELTCVPLKYTHWSPKCDCIWKQGHEGGDSCSMRSWKWSLIWQDWCAYRRRKRCQRPPSVRVPLSVHTQEWPRGHPWAREASPETSSGGPWILTFGFRLWEKKSLLFKPPVPWYFLMAAWAGYPHTHAHIHIHTHTCMCAQLYVSQYNSVAIYNEYQILFL